MPPISVLIKPASSLCNLRCEYCFYHAIADSRSVPSYGIMEESVLEQIVMKVLQFADGVATFSFQGGEPTLCGLDFFRRVIELQEKYNVKDVQISNCLQTNGTLLNEEWAVFLHEHRFLVGLSLDGPAAVHDRYRLAPDGKGTYDKVIKAAEMLDQHQVEYNILLVVNGTNAKKPQRLYQFFRDHGFRYLQFIPCIDPKGVPRGSLPFSLDNERFAGFLKGFFDKWYAEISRDEEVSVRYFDNLVRIAMGIRPETCSMFGTCQCQFVFEADGSVYPCDFYVNDEWRIGRIHDLTIEQIAMSETALRFMKQSINVPEECARCEWYRLCKNGCRRDREDNVEGDLGVNCYCSAYREFFEYAFPRIQALARHFSGVPVRT